MELIIQNLELLYSVCHVPMTLVDEQGVALYSWPELPAGIPPYAFSLVVEDFRLQRRDELHPLISFLGTGYLLGVMKLRTGVYLVTGLIPTCAQTPQDVFAMMATIVHSSQLQSVCDFILQMPLMSLHQLKDYMCLLGKTVLGQNLAADHILFVDILSDRLLPPASVEQDLFSLREEPEFHIPVDFEDGICDAIAAGNRARLERCLYNPVQGRVGRMSSSEIRQQKYAFICMITLVCRAAIRGGLPAETAFSLSDLYCQRVDLLSELPHIQNLTHTMLMDYCDRVGQLQKRPAVSPVIESCLSYISIHLHQPITLEQLSKHCGLCSRSLSLRFKKELGMAIPDYIHQEKIKEAQYLLSHTAYSISEITAFLNYPSQSYFTQIFKKHCGTTPQQYRNRQSHI